MPWLIVAVLVWIIVLLVVRLKELGRLWSAGFWSILVAYFLNEKFLASGFYTFEEALYSYQGIPLSYLAAIAGLAIITMHFLPETKGWQLPFLILLSAVKTALEFFMQEWGFLLFVQWSLVNSFFFSLISLITIVWLSNLTIKPQQKGYFF